jgi:hypothetical protein
MGKCHDEIVRKFVESPLTKVMNKRTRIKLLEKNNPEVEVTYLNSAEVMLVVEKPIGNPAAWEFPAASYRLLNSK